jgi:hypothetical protein
VKKRTPSTSVVASFFGSEPQPARTAVRELLSRDGVLDAASRAWFTTREVGEQMVESLLAMLDVPLVDMALPAWRSIDVVRAACAETRATPGVRTVRPLPSHALEGSRTGVVELEWQGGRYRLCDVTIVAVLEVEPVTLDVEDGRVTRVRGGNATGTLHLRVNECTLDVCSVTVPLGDVVDVDLTSVIVEHAPV